MKTFYSTEDIEALAAQGITRLVVDENTVLTHLARDLAPRLGVTLVYGTASAQTAPRLASGATPPGPAPRLGAKPKGCQHAPLSPSGPVPGKASSSPGSMGPSDSENLTTTGETVRELVDLVKQLSSRDRN